MSHLKVIPGVDRRYSHNYSHEKKGASTSKQWNTVYWCITNSCNHDSAFSISNMTSALATIPLCFHVKVLHLWWFITNSQFTIHHYIGRQVRSFWTNSEWPCTMSCNIANTYTYHSSPKELTRYKKSTEKLTNMH